MQALPVVMVNSLQSSWKNFHVDCFQELLHKFLKGVAEVILEQLASFFLTQDSTNVTANSA